MIRVAILHRKWSSGRYNWLRWRSRSGRRGQALVRLPPPVIAPLERDRVGLRVQRAGVARTDRQIAWQAFPKCPLAEWRFRQRSPAAAQGRHIAEAQGAGRQGRAAAIAVAAGQGRTPLPTLARAPEPVIAPAPATTLACVSSVPVQFELIARLLASVPPTPACSAAFPAKVTCARPGPPCCRSSRCRPTRSCRRGRCCAGQHLRELPLTAQGDTGLLVPPLRIVPRVGSSSCRSG